MRDLTKVLSDADAVKLRALLAAQPDVAITSPIGQEYPKMLFHRHYIDLYRLIKDNADPLVKKEAQQQLNRVIVVVHNIEDEEEYLADKWRGDPNDFIVMAVEEGGLGEADPRRPTGREGRRAEKMNRATRETELRDLRRRYAELTGKRLADDPGETPIAAQPPYVDPVPKATAGTKAPSASTKRERVAAATKRATGGTSAHP